MLICGIDPGLYGAIALLDPATGGLEVHDIPILNVGTRGSRKMVIDEVSLATLFDNRSEEIGEVWIEQVGPRPGEGVVGAFSFGRTYGLIRGVLAANFLRVNAVMPSVWKKAMGVKGDKDHSRLRASQEMPRHAHLWPLKKHDGRAEAGLIARYGCLKKGIVP